MRSTCTKKVFKFEPESKLCTESTRRVSRRLSESIRTEMPSVGMRRTTRVFGGARVLRSGRRLWPESGDVKLRRTKDGDQWLPVVKNNVGGGDGLSCKCAHSNGDKRNEDVDTSEIKVPKETKRLEVGDRMFGKVYSRKRKGGESFNLSDDPDDKRTCLGDRKFGIQFFRRRRVEKSGLVDSKVGFEGKRDVLSVFVEMSCSGCFVDFMYSVLKYMRRVRLRVRQLSGFVLAQPICGVFASHGIHFLQGHSSTIRSGTCMFFGALQFMPLFFVDFSAIPLCFMHMHSRLFLRMPYLRTLFENKLDVYSDTEIMTEDEEDCLEIHYLPKREYPNCKTMTIEVDHIENISALHPFKASKLVGRSTQYRNILGYRGIQKRRSSLRSRRARIFPFVGTHKPNGSLISERTNARKHGFSFSLLASGNKNKQIIMSSSSTNSREVSSNKVAPMEYDGPSHCSANILIIECDKCYREEGAMVMLETSTSSEWVLAVKKDGSVKYTHKAEKLLKPCSSNRFTHAIMWPGDSNWKLEFLDRQDWLIFKDLYKECFDRNIPATSVKAIPVPGVRIISDYAKGNCIPFRRPDSYILVKTDEVSRAMEKNSANYDMDSDDEEWLNKFNNEFIAQNEVNERVSEGAFELMIDAFEKGFYTSPDSISDEKAATNLCSDLGRGEVAEAVYSHWMKKRKQKRSSLLRVFQGHQAKNPPVIQKPILRKRRTLKRQPSQVGRGKQPSVVQGMVSEQNAMEEQNLMLKSEEAKVSAKKSEELATLKRQRAQLLMSNADLATYKATMALQIAETAAQTATDAASHFLD